MKIIDLLNMISKGEEVPEHIKIGKNEWYFYKSRNTYGDKKSGWIVWDWYVEENRLNDEVEILEEEKKIPEKLNLDTDELRGKETPMAIDYLIEDKINEVIDYLKSKGDE